MKFNKKLIAILLSTSFLFSTFAVPIHAEEVKERNVLENAYPTYDPAIKTALETLILDAEGLNKRTSIGTKAGNATEEQKNKFTKLIEDAKLLLTNNNLSDEDLNKHIEAITKGFSVLRDEKITWQPYSSYINKDTSSEKRHFRATWIATVINMDWPSKQSTQIKNIADRIKTQKNELIAKLDEAEKLKLNAVIFQIRPTSDAFYKSEIEPWSYFLTGELDKDPGYDPLAFAITEAHKRNLELHAWFNPYRVSMTANFYTVNGQQLTTIDQVKDYLSTDPTNIYSKHPEWTDVAQNRLVLDPGIPEVTKHVENVIMEVASSYDVDAIHFDDYFYTGTAGGEDGIKDQDTFEKYGSGFTDIKDWRRNNIQTLISNLSTKIKTTKPWLKFGISPAGVWRNIKDDPEGSDTQVGAPNYDHAYADTRKWVEENTIDYLVPQIYWSAGREVASYTIIADWWSKIFENTNTHLYIGQPLYKMTLADRDKNDDYLIPGTELANTEMNNQLKYNLANSNVKGSVLFRHNNLSDPSIETFIPILTTKIWPNFAFVPEMKHLGGRAPLPPTITELVQTAEGVKITWVDKEVSTDELQRTKYFAIYKGETIDTNDTSKIIGVISSLQEKSFVDTNGKKGDVYRITAFNRLHDESVTSVKKSLE